MAALTGLAFLQRLHPEHESPSVRVAVETSVVPHVNYSLFPSYSQSVRYTGDGLAALRAIAWSG